MNNEENPQTTKLPDIVCPDGTVVARHVDFWTPEKIRAFLSKKALQDVKLPTKAEIQELVAQGKAQVKEGRRVTMKSEDLPS